MTTRDEYDALAASYKAQHAQMGLTGATSQYFENGPDAFELAKRKAKYSHRKWIVWRPTGMAGRKCARLTQETLEEAIADVQGETFAAIEGTHAYGMNVRPWLAKVWLENMKAGCFAY
jgi:hypothetical protein